MLKIYRYLLPYLHLQVRKITDTLFHFRSEKLFSKYLECDKPAQPRSESPVIVIGMHRSGTTLVTRLLEDLCVSMGNSQGINTSEDFFFSVEMKFYLK